MSPAVRRLVSFIGFAMLAVAGVGFALPTRWRVERSLRVSAPPAAVFPLVADYRRWKEWAWGEHLDPTLDEVFEGPQGQVGARYAWKGERLGQGWLLTDRASPQEGLTYRSAIQGNGEENGRGSIQLRAEGTGTRVTWVDEGEAGRKPFGGYFLPLVERSLGLHFEEALGRLGRRAEAAPVPTSTRTSTRTSTSAP